MKLRTRAVCAQLPVARVGNTAVADLMSAPAMDRGPIEATAAALRAALTAFQAPDLTAVMSVPVTVLVAIALRDADTAERLAKNAAAARSASAAIRALAATLDEIAARVDVALEARSRVNGG